MKILIISPTQKGIGGTAQHVQGLSNFCKRYGHNVDIISSENTFTVPVKGLKNPSFMISAFFKTKLKRGYDIAHAFNLPAALPMKHASGKKVLTLTGVHPDQVELLHGKTAGKLSRNFEKDALEWADALTAMSKTLCDHYAKLGFKVHHIPNAIDFSSLSEGKDKRYEKQIIFAGRLSKEKGILDVLKMSEKLPQDIHLIILGSGPEEKKVGEVFENKTNLHFLGYQTKEKTVELIRGSDILIQPSLFEGGLSSTLLESMYCKTPIISSNIDINKEMLRHMETAFLVNCNSPDEILNGILELLSDKQKRITLIEHAYKVANNYDWSVVGKMYLDLYSKLCSA
ncbi:MAG: glycosyltransferase family 4 protein [Nitrososphaeraceae archaeon]